MPTGAKPTVGSASGPHIRPRTMGGIGGPAVAGPLAGPQAGSRIVTIAYDHVALQDIANAAGVAEVILPAPPGGFVALIERIYVSTNSTTATEAVGFIGDAIAENEVEFTGSGNRDVADEVQPILVPTGQVFRIRWTNMTPVSTSKAVARIQYRLAAIIPRG